MTNFKKSLYIAFEGIEGCGKSTQCELLVARLRREFPKKEIVLTREPGGTEISEAIRNILLNPEISKNKMESLTEVYLFAAARTETLRKIVKPGLERGAIVVSDRCLYANLAYQGFGRELGVVRVWEINLPALEKTLPDLVVFPDVSVEVGFGRIRDREKDRMEKEEWEFHKRVREGYLFLAEDDRHRFLVVDGSLSVDEQAEIIWERVAPLIRDLEPIRELQIRGERE
ncbi:MAG TPA: dTMP kinase [Nevskiaceae bacterium]|nr:dTMP kinase [Nevskiaceae bacterium]